jgi:glutamate dehydrogenase
VPEELALRVAGLSAMLSALDIVEVAAASGASLRHVAGVYYALGARLELHWLRDEITALPRDNRWQTLARAALRDELYGVHRALTREALEAAPAADPEAAVETWQARNRAGVERTRQVLVDIHMGGLSSLETLSVALREIRNLIQSGARLPEHVAAFPPDAQPEPAPPPPESLRLG